MLETLGLMRRSHFKMSEKHQRLQADKRNEGRDSKAWSEAERPNPKAREIFHEFLLTWRFAFPHDRQQQQHPELLTAGSAASTALNICVTAAHLPVTASPDSPAAPQHNRAQFLGGQSLFQSWSCRRDRSVGSACISYSATFQAEIQLHFQSFNHQQFTETPETFWLQLPINVRIWRAWLCWWCKHPVRSMSGFVQPGITSLLWAEASHLLLVG